MARPMEIGLLHVARFRVWIPLIASARYRGSRTDKRLQRGTFTAFRNSMWTDGIATDGSRHDEGLGIMNHEWLEGVGRTFHQRFVAFHQIEDIEGAAGVMRDLFGEPMPPGLNELARVQSGALLAPAIARAEQLNAVHQIILRPFRGAIPLDIGQPMPQVNRARFAIKTETIPVPQFEGENIRRGADLQHHGFGTAAMHRARWDQKV